MSVPLPSAAETAESAAEAAKVTLNNVFRAFERSGLANLFLNALIPNEEEQPQMEKPRVKLDSLRSAVAPHQELTVLRSQIEPPVQPVKEEEPVGPFKPNWQRLGEGLTLDVANFTTPSAFIAALRAYAKTPDAQGNLRTTRYVWGGEGSLKEGVDCSGLIMAALTHQLHLAQGDAGAGTMCRHLIQKPKKGAEKAREAQVGDLLFTVKRDTQEVTHVMVIAEILGNGKVRVIESSGGGWSDQRTIDLVHGTSAREYHFGTPKFYRS